MSYLVLARKYRPHSFEELVGQEHVVQALSNALTQQRLHHAYLFTGTRGVGKTTVSRILAKSLNCTGPDGTGGITATPCGQCDACRDIDAGRFVDYVELDAASNRGVEEISQLLDQAVYKPVMGRFKVYMIDEVHMLSNTAFNAMLKTLEEPPEYLKFVLATTDPQKVPVTVLSRCLQFNLRPMAPQNVLSHLTNVLQAENVPAEAGALRLLSRSARGSMRDALSLTDQAIAFGAGSLTEAGVRQMLGSVDRSHVTSILDALIAADGGAVVAQADALRTQGLSAAGTLEDMASLLQQMAVAQAAPKALDDHDPDTAEARRLAALLPADEIQLIYSMALHGRQELSLAPDEYAGLLMVLLRMLSFRPAGAAAQQPVKPAVPASEPAARPVPAQVSAPLLAPAVAAATAVAVKPAAPEPAPVAPIASARVAEPVPAPALMSEPDPEPTPAPSPAAPAPMQALDPKAPSARLRPRAVVLPVEDVAPQQSSRGGDNEPPPWLDVSPDDAGASGNADMRGDEYEASIENDDLVEPGGPAEAGAYVSTAGTDVAFEPTPLGERWHAQIMSLGLTALPRELAMQAQCMGAEEQGEMLVWRLRVERDSLRQPALKDKLQAALSTALQRPVRLELEVGVAQDSPTLREAAAAQARQRDIERIVIEDPVAQALLAQFKTARIVPGSIRSTIH